MKLYCVYTDSHQILLDEFFRKTIKDDYEIIAIKCDIQSNYHDQSFRRAILFKIDEIIKSIQDNMGEVIIWSDVDICFYRPTWGIISKHLEKCNFVISREHRDGRINSGFFATQCSKPILDLFSQLREEVASLIHEQRVAVEQVTMQRMIDDKHIEHVLLPPTFWNMTCGSPIPKDIVFHHCNCSSWYVKEIGHLRWNKMNLPLHIEMKWKCLDQVRHYVKSRKISLT